MSSSAREGTQSPSKQSSDTRESPKRPSLIQPLKIHNPPSLCSSSILTLRQFLEFGPEKLNIRLLRQEETNGSFEVNLISFFS